MSTDFEVENDTFDFESPEDFKTGGAFLAEGDDGTYHVEVSAIEKDPKKRKGNDDNGGRVAIRKIRPLKF
mgnify:CR=1 FL=1